MDHNIDFLTQDGFRQIKDYPRYFINSSGKIYNTRSNIFMKAAIIDASKSHDLRLNLCNQTVRRTLAVKHLVAETFPEMIFHAVEEGKYLLHKNGDYLNCDASNLVYCNKKPKGGRELIL